ncbi:MAG: hypothetical protein ABR924_13270, partial [Terracidiphilus sp.]
TVFFLVEVLPGFAVAFVFFTVSAMKVSSIKIAAKKRTSTLEYRNSSDCATSIGLSVLLHSIRGAQPPV